MPKLKTKKQQIRSLFVGGLLPVILFTVIEDRFGTLVGLIAGMVFGAGEVLWEWKTQGKVETVTWIANGMILVLGGVSLATQDGIWFKLQPALIEISTTLFLWGSVLLKKSVLLNLLQKQGAIPNLENPVVHTQLKKAFQGLTLRMGLFFAIHAALATWAAFYWSTAAWAVLKGVGLTVSMIVYMVVESFILRYKISSNYGREHNRKNTT